MYHEKCGAWSPNEISNIKSPLFIYHGTNDSAVPVKYAVDMKAAGSAQDKPVTVSFLKGGGHGIGDAVYSNLKVWNQILFLVE